MTKEIDHPESVIVSFDYDLEEGWARLIKAIPYRGSIPFNYIEHQEVSNVPEDL